MDFETLIALAIIIGGGLISAFKKEKPINQPRKPADNPQQQPRQPQVCPEHRAESQPAKPHLRSIQKSESLENALGELAAMFGGDSAPKMKMTPPPMPEVKKRHKPIVLQPENLIVKLEEKSAPKPSADVPEFAKIHDIFKDEEPGGESVYEEQPGSKIFSSTDDLKKAVVASEILNRKY